MRGIDHVCKLVEMFSREGKKLVKQETGYNYWSDFSKQGGVESIAEVEKG